MGYYTLKQCVSEKLAAEKAKGQFECRRLGVCPLKKFSGFRIYCLESPMYENITFPGGKNGGTGEEKYKK